MRILCIDQATSETQNHVVPTALSDFHVERITKLIIGAHSGSHGLGHGLLTNSVCGDLFCHGNGAGVHLLVC